MRHPHHSWGFTLTELAIVLVIIALLIGGLLVPASGQRDIEQYRETERRMRDIREALLGFVVTYGRLPCPDTDIDPTAAGYGIEEVACQADVATEGFLPWKTLGVSEYDAWGSPWQNVAQARLGHWRYRVERKYADATNLAQVKTLLLDGSANNSNPCAAIPPAFPNDCLSLVNNASVPQALNENKERPIAIVFSSGKDLLPNGENSTYEATSALYQADVPGTITATGANFDDALIWISRSGIASRMIAAGKLP